MGLRLESTLNLHGDDGILRWDVLFAMVSGVDDWCFLGRPVTWVRSVRVGRRRRESVSCFDVEGHQ